MNNIGLMRSLTKEQLEMCYHDDLVQHILSLRSELNEKYVKILIDNELSLESEFERKFLVDYVYLRVQEFVKINKRDVVSFKSTVDGGLETKIAGGKVLIITFRCY